jgi:eukaryotic-like serine/threonine-protein kinase
MPFATDTPLGPYKIVALIGSGGMGEVYRAHDTRLRRDVALKILPASFTNDPDRLRRFEQEARAVAALNHPNIVSIYDVGEAGGVHYIVSELLEGDSLRERIPAAGLPTRKAIEFAVQFANGLAAAHDRGIVHRDLKPENIFITKTGQVKILDFGLAKLRDAETQGAGDPSSTGISNATVVDAHTSAGQILGTVGYMSPEQVRGDAVDHRADIFSFGSILYEMLCGQRAFKRNTSAETMTAILNEDPQDFATRTNSSGSIAIPPALERIVRHCLEKQPAQRFQSIRDIAFDLESVSSVSATSASGSNIVGTRARNRWVRALAAGLALLALGAVLDAYLRPRTIASSPELHRLTFGRGNIRSARFAGTDVLYSAAWNGRPMDVYLAHPGSTESRLLGMPHSNVLAVSKSGELAILLNQHFVEGFEYVGSWRVLHREAVRLETSPTAWNGLTGRRTAHRSPSCAAWRGKSDWNIRWASFFTRPLDGSAPRVFRPTENSSRLSITRTLATMPAPSPSSTSPAKRRLSRPTLSAYKAWLGPQMEKKFGSRAPYPVPTAG